MPDQPADRNKQLKATMRDENTGNLNISGKEGVIVRSPSQCGRVRRAQTVTLSQGRAKRANWRATRLEENHYDSVQRHD